MAVAELLISLLSGCPGAISDEKRNRPGAFPRPLQPDFFLSPEHSPAEHLLFWGTTLNTSVPTPPFSSSFPTHATETPCLQKISKEQAGHGSPEYLRFPAWRGHLGLSSVFQRELSCAVSDVLLSPANFCGAEGKAGDPQSSRAEAGE